MPKRIFFSVGEPSGDLHAANLIKRLRQQDPEIEAIGFGGPRMRGADCELLFDLTKLAVMFLGGAIKNLRTFFRLIAEADQFFANNDVDAVVLIDYPGFNWWIARKAKKHGVKVFYYGVPQMWAWAPWRISKIRKFVDHVICKLPFEPKWFSDRGCEAHYVGHPYFDQLHQQTLDRIFIESMQSDEHDGRDIVLLLPGSRDQEVKSNLDCLLRSARKIQAVQANVRMVMGCFNEEHRQMVNAECENAGVEVYVERTQELMHLAKACIACSGSVSLELLYHRLPTVIVYKIKWWFYCLQSIVLRCKFISLPNLMYTDDIRRTNWRPHDPDSEGAEKVIMPEYLTTTDCSAAVAQQILKLLESDSHYASVVEAMEKLANGYAAAGATSRAADYIIENLDCETGLQDQAA